MRTLAPVLLVTKVIALAGFLAGGALAAWEISRRPFVLEFQAGLGSSFGEKLFAIIQRAAVEGLGLGLVGAVLALLAWSTASPWRRADEAPLERRFAANSLLVVAAFALWMLFGATLLGQAVPFLRASDQLLLELAGFACLAVGMAIFSGLTRKLPRSPRDEPLASAVASLVVLGVVAVAAKALLKSATDGRPGALHLLGAAACAGVGLVLVNLLARPLAPVLARVRQALCARRLLPRRVQLGLLLLLLLAALIGRPFLGLSPVAGDVRYARLADRGSPPGPNVVLVTVDTLRADHLSCYGYERPTSPFLDELAEAGTRFDEPVAPAAWTKPSTGTILTGLYPSRHGALYHGSSLNVPEGLSTLAETFSRAGYVTAGFVSNPNVKKVFDFDRGFDEYFDSPAEDTVARASLRDSIFGRVLKAFTGLQFNWKYENDVRQMNRQIFAWLEENSSERFFLYLHYIDPHEPYAPPREYEEMFEQDHGMPLFDERKRLVGVDLYDGEIRYADEGLRELAAELERLGVWEDTVFVLTSDHGEEFFEHGVLGHGFSVYQPVIRVPLLAHGPGVTAGQVVEEPVHLVDLPATVLDLAGLGDELGDGHSFAGAMRTGEWSPLEHLQVENEFGRDEGHTRSYVLNSVREGAWKLVLTEANLHRPPSDPRYGPLELYNLEEDPGETRNRIAEPEVAEIRERLLTKLRDHKRWLDEHGLRDSAPAELNSETEAALKALGYL